MMQQSIITSAEKQVWRQHHQSNQGSRLTTLKRLLSKQPPAFFANHLDSILLLLTHGMEDSRNHATLITIIEQLHPWPLYWRAWRGWGQQLHFATQYFEQTNQLSKQLYYQLEIANLRFEMGNLPAVIALCEKVSPHALANGWPALFAHATYLYTQALIAMGRNANAKQLFASRQQMIEILISAETSPKELLTTQIYMTWLHMRLLRWEGNINLAIKLGANLITLLEEQPIVAQPLVARTYHRYGIQLWIAGEYDRALQHIGHARQLYEQIGDEISSYIMGDNMGLVYWSMGQFDKAEAALKDSLRLMREIKAQWHIVRLVGDVSVVYIANGEIEMAASYIEEHNRLALQVGDEHEIYRSEGNLATMLLCQAHYEEVIRLKQKQLATERDFLFLMPQVVTLIELSEAWWGLGDIEKSAEYAQQAWSLHKQITGVPTRIFALRGIAKHCNADEGRRLLKEAIQLSKQYKRRLDIAACQFDLIRLTESISEKQQLWQEAGVMLETMQASTWLRDRSLDNPPQLPYLL